MSRKNLVRFNTGGRDPLTLFQVKVSGSFTIPDSKTVTSVVDTAVGGANLGSIVAISGGQLLTATSDAASGSGSAGGVFDLTGENVCDLFAGDIVAMSAVSGSKVTLTVTSLDGTVRTYVYATTTTATVVGYYA